MKLKHMLATLCILVPALALMAITPFQTLSQSKSGLRIRFQTPNLKIESEEIGGESFHRISAEDAMSSALDGMPELPVFSTSFALPPTGGFRINVVQGSQRIVTGIRPVPVFPADEDRVNLQYNRSAYVTSDLYPADPVVTGDISIFRDFRVAQVSITPAKWHASSGDLVISEDMELEIEFTPGSAPNEMPGYQSYSAAFRNLYEANIINFDQYRELNPVLSNSRILIIYGNYTNTVYNQLITSFAEWKRRKGHEVNVVSTSVAGTSNTAIKNYIQTQYNNLATRPDYIILIGDTTGSFPIPTWIENWSSYQGEGDYPYTFLAGNDTVGDVLIGRLSAETVEQLSTIMSRNYSYERNINNDPAMAEWLNRMLLIGDPSTSGISCVYTNKYVKELAQNVNPDYSFIENYSGGYPNTINSGINQGVSFFNYRGYIGMSSWSPSSSLVNNPRFPHAVILTCGTGSFASTYAVATTEAFTRLGTSANPNGAVTAIGMATSGTHTMFNNALTSGIFNGIFTHKMRTMGEALLNGRYYLKELYGATHMTQVNYFSHWCNLMGDPTLEVFVGIPKTLVINAQDEITTGSTAIDVQVTDDTQNPLSEVSVTAYSTGQNLVLAKGFTDALGNLTLTIGGGITGEIMLTASKHDSKPAQKTVVTSGGGIVHFAKYVYDDGTLGSMGNSDGFISAGETAAMTLEIKNTSAQQVTGISAVVTCDEPHITVLSGNLTWADTPANGTNLSSGAVLFSVEPTIPAYEDLRFVVTVADAEGETYVYPVHVSVYNANLSVESHLVNAGGNNILDPTETGFLNVTIRNNSVAGIYNVYAEITSLNDLLLVNDNSSYVGSILPGAAASSMDGFEVFARALLIPGMQMPVRVRFFNDSGFEQYSTFNIPIGTVSQNTPLGPDAYGYFIYDVSDLNYSDCPTYDWIEICPQQGGSGTLLSTLNDQGVSGDEGDQVGSVVLETVTLPFPFSFYGVEYNQITVCVNGFIAMGQTTNGEFRNGRLPAGTGPSPMIAPFWDDLILLSDSGIYKYYDAANHWFIIEYYKMRNGYNRTSLETFQVIFYDPVYHPTSLGDGKIKIQYKDFNNVDVGGGGYSPVHGNYSTIGIKDHTNTRGLEYTYNNQYPAAAAPLSSLKALMITTVPVLHEYPHLIIQDLMVTDPNGNGTLEPGEIAEIGIRLINQGINTAENVTVTASLNSPHAQLMNGTSTYPNIPGDNGEVNSVPITVRVNWDCPDNTTLNFNILIQTNDNQWNYPVSLTVKKPSLNIRDYYMNDISGNGNGLVEPGENVKIVVNYQNTSPIDAKYITSNLTCLSEYVTITNSEVLFSNIPAMSLCQAIYDVQISETAPMGNNITFLVTYLGELINPVNEQLIISLGTIGMNEDFEETNGNFTANPVSNGWEWGVSTFAGAHSGTKVWGTRLNTQYPGAATYTLTTPDVYIGSNFMLEFWHKYSTEATYDGGNVKISTNNGSTWTLLNPEGGYTDSYLTPLVGAGYSGNSNGWQLARFPLSSYANQTVMFRFTFASDNNIHGEGWFIDDVRTTGYLEYAGKVSGLISSGNPGIAYSNVLVRDQGNTLARPDNQGYYEMYSPMGNQTVGVSSPGYGTPASIQFLLSMADPAAELDFYLPYLNPGGTISYSLNTGTLNLTWQAPVDTEYPILGYEIYRRYGAGLFEMVDQVAQPQYTCQLINPGTYRYYVQTMYEPGTSLPNPAIEFSFAGVANEDPQNQVIVTRLNGNYPNPFNPSTSISFSMANPGKARLSIYNLKGQLVNRLLDGDLTSGTHRIVWDGRDDSKRSVPSGIYLYRLETGKYQETKRMILMK